MRSNTIKQQTIDEVKKVLKKRKIFYVSTDFPFLQVNGIYLTYKAKVMNAYLRQRGYLMLKAKDYDFSLADKKHSIRGNRLIWISATNFINNVKPKGFENKLN